MLRCDAAQTAQAGPVLLYATLSEVDVAVARSGWSELPRGQKLVDVHALLFPHLIYHVGNCQSVRVRARTDVDPVVDAISTIFPGVQPVGAHHARDLAAAHAICVADVKPKRPLE